MKKSANLVAIVGRPNVGKSTLFNRLVERRDAIMDNESGVTRDRHYGQAEWTGKSFTVVDTGGYVVGSEDTFEEAIREQVEIAIEESTVLLFVVDVETGLTDLDREFGKLLRRSKKPIYLVANKADTGEKAMHAYEFYELGMGEPMAIASASGFGTGDLLDEVVSNFPEDEDEEEEAIPRIAVIGRPNVGKSSLTNLLLNKERSIVTDIAGTTRDAVDAKYNAFGKEFILTDTAGLRRKAKAMENVEFYSVMRTIKAIERSDVCIAVLDATRGIESQDLSIINLAIKNKKGIVIMVNKWDLIEKDTNTAREFEKKIQERLGGAAYIPIITTSVLEKQRISKVIDKAIEVYENRKMKVMTSALNEIIGREIERRPPPAHRGHHIKIKYITQLPIHTPVFAFFSNYPRHVKGPYKSFIENKIREHFGFEGVPMGIVFKEK
ncbi:ribosome biogenesis GTPase Der [Flammeovirga yaeyamensis]|uniref:GTPase Der n=1 Tax=Flammeovirga yaeyamensis TaxID=367791 RepID=A0AAX1N712_9BACT|nr:MULTISPECIES: ribosome biogenesis GTPase Der [Flammeovirga]ANQ50799.1 ribosome biogenesis GTPase Der [Flammeovirga sp. MY04]MBB3700814.1 GTP-binding protein [Flammeovirga yaeyamensis]NMF37831.1 ribosome biogenesis GTPase Der [Flammeovirga yaeyamensis]QWG01807.1 ribosome biogenesis GTPase Der [Flammeovirga yaeyamensis]